MEQVGYMSVWDRTLPGRAVHASRVLIWSVVAMVLIGLAWSALTHVDVVVDARGQLGVDGESVKMSVPEPGIAVKVPVKIGDHVTAGQLLLQLDPFHYDALESRLSVDITAARSKNDIANVRSLSEQLAEVRKARGQLALIAPIAGTITRIAAQHPGVALSLGEPAVVLLPDDLPLVALVRIPNASMRRMKPGSAVRVAFDAFPKEDYGDVKGELLHIAPDADDQGTYRASIKLDRADLRGPLTPESLRPGLQLNAKIFIERRSLLAILLNPLRKFSQPVTVAQ